MNNKQKKVDQLLDEVSFTILNLENQVEHLQKQKRDTYENVQEILDGLDINPIDKQAILEAL